MAKMSLLEARDKLSDLIDKESLCRRLIDKVFEYSPNMISASAPVSEGVEINSPDVIIQRVEGTFDVNSAVKSIDMLTDKIENIRVERVKIQQALAYFEASAMIEI